MTDTPTAIDPAVLPLLAPMLRSAAAIVADGVCSAADVDTAMRLGARHPAGPFELIARLDPATRARHRLPEPAPDGSAPAAAAAADHAQPWSDAPVGVVGTGFMASGIVYTIAVAGQPVRMLGRTEAATASAVASIESALAKASARGRIDERQARAAAARVTTDTRLATLAPCELVIEAVSEHMTTKRGVFSALDAGLPEAQLLATNTSSLRVAEIATATRRPDRVGALHFFSPAAAMRLVEVSAPASLTERACAWARSLGKVPVCCADRPGFIVNSLLIPFLNDAVRLHQRGGGSIAELDELVTSGAGFPMGPFSLLDFIGLDVSLAAQRTLYEVGGDERLRPAELLVAQVDEGRLGRKSGVGFYDYGVDPPTPVNAR